MESCNTTLEQLPHKDWNIAFGVLIASVSILAVFENGFIMLLLYKYPKIRTQSNKILASVVVADCLTGLTVGPLYSVQLMSDVLNQNCILHKVRRVFGVIIMGASLTSITMMTIDRSKHLIHLKSYYMTWRRLYAGIFVCWLLPLAAALLGLISESVHSTIVSGVGVSVIIIITACYVLVIFALRRHRHNTLDKKNTVYKENERKAGKTIIIIISCYFIMLVPLFIEKALFGFKVLDEESLIRPPLHMFTILLCISNSNINPLIYTCRLPAFRKYTLKLFRKGLSTNHHRDSSTMESSTQLLDKTIVYTIV